MTISSTPAVVQYMGDGVSTVFTVPYYFLSSSDLVVTKRSKTGTDAILVLGTDYSVSGAGNTNGGSVTVSVAPLGGTPPETLTIISDPIIQQQTHYLLQGLFPSTDTENALDLLTRISQVIRRREDRSLRAPDGDVNPNMLLPSALLRGAGSGTFPHFAAGSGDIELVTQLASGTPISQSIIGQLLYPQTTAEAAAGVTPVNYAYVPGDVRRYGAVSGGSGAANSTAFQAAINSSADVIVPAGSYNITTPLVAISGTKIRGIGRPTLQATVAGTHIISGVSLTQISIEGILFAGVDSTTVPLTIFTGGAFTDTALVTFNLCTDVRVIDCEFHLFYNGLTMIRSNRIWIERNRISNWRLFGVLLSESIDFALDHNVIDTSDAITTAESYGVMATGDSNNAHPSSANSISFNVIANIPVWDGIMTHEVYGLRIIGNDIRNVRNGIDCGASGANPSMKDLVIANNYIEAITTDTYAGVAAHHTGIIVTGKDPTHLINNVVISGNIINGFFNAAGIVSSGDTGDIVVTYADKASVIGNLICNTGNALGHPGILLAGDTLTALSVTGNVLQGFMSSSAIRVSALIATSLAISGNSIKQTTTANIGVNISGSTIGSLGIAGNAINSDAGAKLVVSTSTVAYTSCDFYNSGSATYDPPNLAAGASATTTVGCSGALVGDFAESSFSLDLSGIQMTAYVSSASTVTVQFYNDTGGAINLASGTLKVRVYPQ